MDNKRTGMSIFFNNQCFERLDVVNDQTGAKDFLYSVDGVEVSQAEWEEKQEQEIVGRPGLGSVQIRP